MVGEIVANRYELERVLGTGGMATVFAAFDTVLERKVALKVLHEQYAADDAYVTRFENEARAAAGLTHPNIVTVMDRGEQDGRRFIVFEHVDGETLKEVVVREGPLPIAEVLRIGADVARGLAFAHANGVVHRDIKPQNVLVDGEGRAKVTDFGIARTGTASGHTETGTILGTGSYISPEQARGDRAGPESDVYALGAVLYELLTGRPPYDGPTFVAVAMRHVRDPVPEVGTERSDCPRELAALVERCLAKTPAERPTAADAAASLQSLSREGASGRAEAALPVDERTMVISRRPPKRKRRLRVPLAIAAALLLAAAAAAVVLLISDEPGAASGRPVTVRAAATYDPEVGDGEHNEELANATDGNPETYWRTEGYSDFDKEGVGLVIDAGGKRLSALTVTSSLPGWTAEIRAGDSQTSFPATVGAAQEAGARTTWELDGEPARFYLIWITAMTRDPDGKERAHVNEVTARS